MAKRIIYFTVSEGCTPCEELGKLVKEGKFSSPDADEIDIVDIGTDEGFERFTKEVLSKHDGAVPSAYLDGKKCSIELEDDMVYFDCPTNDRPEAPDEKSSLPVAAEEPPASPP